MIFETLFVLNLALVPLVSSLQATPDSQCASYCIDSASKNASDYKSFNTFDKDLTCSDSQYGSSDAGKKFKSCNSCLQNSTAEADGINDQGAFMYNLRATVDFCLWGFPNASGSPNSPCSIDYACQPLKNALTYGNLNPSNETQWGYCSADNSAFLGPNLGPCIQCLQATQNEVYLANFLIALEAGCQQRPVPGKTITLNSTVFSKNAVNITTPAPSIATNTPVPGIQQGTVIGIVIGALLVLIAFISLGVVIFRKRQEAARRALGELKSDYDDRYGAQDISAPTMGGFAAPPLAYERDSVPDYEKRAQKVYGTNWSSEDDRTSSQRSLYTQAWVSRTSSQDPALPTHPAYLPPQQINKSPLPQITVTPDRPSTRNKMRPDNHGHGFTMTTFHTTSSSGSSGERHSPPAFSPPTSSSPAPLLPSPGLPQTPKSMLSPSGKAPRVPPKTPKSPWDLWN